MLIMAERVNHPPHYNAGGIECIDALEAATSGLQGIEAFCTANAIKYLWRWKLKTVKRTCKRRFGISTGLFNERAQTAPQERSYSI